MKIAVFCGSKFGKNPQFLIYTNLLGNFLADNNIPLIYGGGKSGLMGAVANSVMEKGGYVIGVMPEILVNKEAAHQNISELHIVKDMHTRKKMMFDLCDKAIILPGGNGTMDELFEIITWNTLKIHSKEIILFNMEHFFDNLLLHFEQVEREEFLYEKWNDSIQSADNFEDLTKYILGN